MVQGTLTEPIVLERPKLVALVRKWADVNTDGLLEALCQIFAIPEVEGFIGYRLEASNAVVLGDPVCAPQDKPALAKAFQVHCASKHLGVVYTIVGEEFADWASQNLDAVAIEFGERLILDPHNNPANKTGSKAVLVRKKVKHALNDGAVIEEYLGEDPQIEEGIQSVATTWLRQRTGPQIYLSHVTLFNDRQGKRWFYALHEGRIVGILMLNALELKNGWLLNNVMVMKNAPKGLSELLVVSALEALERENCGYVLVGPVPGRQLGRITGLSEISAAATRWVYKCSKLIFHLEGHAAFWDKFQPVSESSYLIFPYKNLGYSSIKALLRAYNVKLG